MNAPDELLMDGEMGMLPEHPLLTDALGFHLDAKLRRRIWLGIVIFLTLLCGSVVGIGICYWVVP